MVLDMRCVLSSGMGLPNYAISDEYGGYCGNPSLVLPTVCPVTATTTVETTTDTKTRVLAASSNVKLFF